MKITKDIRKIIFFAILALICSYLFLLKGPLGERSELIKQQEKSDLIQITPLKPVVADSQSAKDAARAIKQEGFEASSRRITTLAKESNVAATSNFNGKGGNNVYAAGTEKNIMQFIAKINGGVQYTKENQLRATSSYAILKDLKISGTASEFNAEFSINPTPLSEK